MTKKAKYETVIDGTQVRVFTTRSEFEVLVGDGDIADPEADVWCYPKVGLPEDWAQQAHMDSKRSQT